MIFHLFKRHYTKRISIGRLSVTIYTRQLVVVYTGYRRVFARTFRIFPLHHALRVFMAGLLLVTVIVLLPGDSPELQPDPGMVAVSVDDSLTDEDRKNILLKSERTDYTEEKDTNDLEIYTHRVEKGENLSEIAKKYGVSMDTICGSNSLQSYDFIREGAQFTIPSRDGILMTVKEGTSIVSLAKKYKISLDKILRYNNIKNPDFIQVGSNLFIPDARPLNIFPGFLWPTASRVVTCGYGWRRNPFNRGQREFHQGLDIRSKYGLVRATKYGKVTFSGWLGGYGNAVILAHPGNIKSLYAHLSRIHVRTGQYVKQGQYIGKAGNTGRSTGPHLHFEIIKQGSHRNPFAYVK